MRKACYKQAFLFTTMQAIYPRSSRLKKNPIDTNKHEHLVNGIA